MTCKLCQQLIISSDDPAHALKLFQVHIGMHHPEQHRELIAQADVIMGWLVARIFRLDGNVQRAFEHTTDRMIKLSNSIRAEIDASKPATPAKPPQ